MELKGALYNVAAFAWMAIVVGAWIAIDLGYTTPWLTFSDIPGGSTGGLAGVIGLSVAGWYAISSLNRRRERAEWTEAGQQAGLRPAPDTGDTEGPKLTGTVDGRTVTTYYDKRKLSSGGDEAGGRWVTFTFGEAELAGAMDEGILVGPTAGTLSANIGTIRFDEMAERAADMEGLVVAETGNLVLVGTSPTAVNALADGMSGKALRAMGNLEVAAIGDASGVVATWAETRNDEMEGAGGTLAEYPVDNLVESVPGDAATATVEITDAIRDGNDLRRFAEGVVAIADAFEAATARTRPSG